MATSDYNDIWTYWSTTGDTTASSTTTTSDIWTGWTASTASSTTTTAIGNEQVWVRWTADPANEYRTVSHQPVISKKERRARLRAREKENRRQQAAIRRQEEEQRKRYAEMEKKRGAAEANAQALLMDLIGPEQLEVYKKTGRLYVRGNQHDYILKKGGLVTQVGKDRVIDMCVHLMNRTSYPETDNVVGLKLALESEDEGEVLKMANYHQYSAKDRKEELPLAACM